MLIRWYSGFPYLNVWSFIQFQQRHGVWRPLCNGFTLVQIIGDPGGKCALCVWKQIENISAHESEEISPHSRSVPIMGSPRLSFCLSWHFFFSGAMVRLDGRNNNSPQNPQQRTEGGRNGWVERMHIFQGVGAASYLVGSYWGRSP